MSAYYLTLIYNFILLTIYKLLFFNDSNTITAGPTKTITPNDISWPITCQLIIVILVLFLFIYFYIFIYYTIYLIYLLIYFFIFFKELDI